MSRRSARITLKDVARRVGVSVNAASKALNDTRSSTKVSEDTRRRILEAAREMGYEPNSAARSLARRRSDIIGLYFERELDTAEPYTAALLEGAEKACKERHQSLILYSRRIDQPVDNVCRILLDGTADGIAVSTWTHPDVLERLEDSHLWVVHYHTVHPSFPSVIIDEGTAAVQALTYLKQKGHRHVYFRRYPDVGKTRVGFYQSTARDLGLNMKIVMAADQEGAISPEEKLVYNLPAGERPTAVACWNDELAYRLLDHLRSINVRVPEDIAVVGFDGARTFPKPPQRLTTVHAPWSEVALTAVRMLCDLRDGVNVPHTIQLPVGFIVGDTA